MSDIKINDITYSGVDTILVKTPTGETVEFTEGGKEPVLQEKTATPTTSTFDVLPDEGYDGLNKVTVSAVDSSIDSNITPANIRLGVTVLGVEGNLEPDKPNQTKSVTPTTSYQAVRADTGYELELVAVHAVTSSIDSNIIPENIKPGVTILGVTGNMDVSDVASQIIATALNTEV